MPTTSAHRRAPGPAIPLLALATALSSLAGCEFTPDPIAVDPGAGPLAVHAVLAAGDDDARLLLTRYDPGLAGEISASTPVSGATVLLLAGADTLRLSAGTGCLADDFGGQLARLEIGCYRGPVPGGVRAGARFRLLIRLPDGAAATGETTVPHPPSLQEPAALDTLRFGGRSPDDASDPFHLVWNAPGAALVDLRIPVTGAACQTLLTRVGDANAAPALVWEASHRAATARVHGVSCNLPERPDLLSANLVLTAFDSVYASYLRALDGAGIPDGAASAGLVGAVGVFGGAASVAVPVVLRRR